MKVFRWSGLIGFVVVLTLLLVIGFCFIDNWVKAGIESGGTRINGAEVTVGDVDLTFSPIGFTLADLRITDAAEPSKNLFELDQARIQLRLAPLFLGRINIEAMIVDGMRTGTERRRPGRVLHQDPASATGSSKTNTDNPAANGSETAVSEPSNSKDDATRTAEASLPDPTRVALDNLSNTRSAISRAETELQTASGNLGSALDALPNDASLADYERRLNALTERRLNSIDAVRQSRDDLNALAEQAARDQRSVANARQAAHEAVQTAETALAEVRAAPATDWDALRDNYPLNTATATRFGRMLLGAEIFDQLEQIQHWYQQISPWLARLAPQGDDVEGPQRLEGRYVRFAHPNPSPNFLLAEALIGFEADGQPWRLQLLDVTGQQRLTGKPVRIEIVKGDLDNPRLRIDGVLDRRGDEVHDRFALFGRNLGLAARSLAVSDAQLDWLPGQTDLVGNVDVIDRQLDGSIQLQFSDSDFQVNGNNRTATLLNQALSSVSAFDMGIAVDGTLRRPQLSLTSDLDNQLNQALSRAVREQYDRWLAQSRTSIDAQAAQLRAPLDERLADVRAERDRVQAQADQFQSEVTDRIEAERDRLNQDLRRLESQAKDAVKDQIKKLDLPF